MKILSFFSFIFFILTVVALMYAGADAQWLEATVTIPDSIIGVTNPRCFACDTISNKVYVSGGCYVLVIDGHTHEKIKRIQVEGSPSALIWHSGLDKIYSANKGSNTISVIDCCSDSIICTIQLDIEPNSLLLSPFNAYLQSPFHNKLYVGSSASSCQNLCVIDCTVDEVVAEIYTGSRPYALACDTKRQRVFVANFSWNGELIVVDGKTDTVMNSIEVEQLPCAVLYDSLNDKIYVANRNSNSISVIDAATDSVIDRLSQMYIISGPNGFTFNSVNNKVYCSNGGSNYVTIIDGGTHNIIDHLSVGQSPKGIIWNPINNKVYCGCRYSGWVAVIDGEQDTLVGSVNTWGLLNTLTCNPVNNEVYVANNNDIWCYPGHSITVIDGETDSISDVIETGSLPEALVWNSINNKIYVADRCGKHIYVIHGETNNLVKRIEAGWDPHTLWWSDFTNKLYVGCGTMSYSSFLYIIEGENDSILTTIHVGSSPGSIIGTGELGKIYVACWNGNVHVIDGLGDTLITTIYAGQYHTDICYNVTNGKIYTNNRYDTTVTVMGIDNDSVLKSIRVGERPLALAWNAIDNKIYVTSTHGMDPFQGNSIAIIDGEKDSVIKTINLDFPGAFSGPCALFWNSETNKIYAARGEWFDILAIDCENDSIIADIYVGDNPKVFGWDSLNNKIYVGCGGGSEYVCIVDGNTDEIIKNIHTGEKPSDFAYNVYQNRMYVSNYFSNSVSVIKDIVGIEEDSSYIGNQIYIKIVPNPFLRNTTFNYRIPFSSMVSLRIYDMTGRLIETIVDGEKHPGNYITIWDAKEFPSGIYFAKFTVGDNRTTKKLILMK